jgi:hypothetical protein
MKKIITLSFILVLLSLAASAQRYRLYRIRPNANTILPDRFRPVSPDQYRLRTEYFRLRTARERILSDGIITPAEKRKIKRIKHLRQHRRYILPRLRRLS